MKVKGIRIILRAEIRIIIKQFFYFQVYRDTGGGGKKCKIGRSHGEAKIQGKRIMHKIFISYLAISLEAIIRKKKTQKFSPESMAT